MQPGDRVAVFMGNTLDPLIAEYRIWDAAAVPINAKPHGKEAGYPGKRGGAPDLW
ncbi:MAG: long-chain fatty acid--CoA ligase, partial [Rhodobacteraceae bacterium]|nr:long-chain fatty acid--CoA ligase [Paracoccaceae bacterium]